MFTTNSAGLQDLNNIYKCGIQIAKNCENAAF
jgi:hypothetical protein